AGTVRGGGRGVAAADRRGRDRRGAPAAGPVGHGAESPRRHRRGRRPGPKGHYARESKMKAKTSADREGALASPQVGAAAPAQPEVWELRLYVAGKTAKSIAAQENLQRLCEEHLPGQYRIEIIDLLVNPQLARGDQIVAIPTLVRKLPHPMRKIIGDLSNTERTLVGLQLRPMNP